MVIDWPLPDTEELSAILARGEKDLPSRIPIYLNGNRLNIIQAMRGLSAFEAGSVLLSAIAATGELSESCIPFIVAEKSQIIKKDKVLEYFDETVTMAEVGGLKNLKTYAGQVSPMWLPSPAKEPGGAVVQPGFINEGKTEIASISGMC